MITTIILALIYGVIVIALFPLTLLPDVTENSNVVQALSSANDYLSSVNNILPVNTLVTILLTFLAFEATVVSFKVIIWLVRTIRG